MKTLTSALDADATVERLKQAVDAAGLRVVAHINGQANARLIGKEVPADQILEIFRPDFALRVWAACKPAGIDIPLRIHVYDDAGATRVACRLPSSVFAPFDSEPLAAIGAELDALFEGILQQVPTSAG
jgi:uncharacterized protein (DUF302 family)